MIKENKWFVQNEIAEKVIELSGINIFERSRKREIVEMRSLFFYILRNKLDMGLTEISRYFSRNRKNDSSKNLYEY
jgi:chromosomal replication initiation ATPase DnaA